MRTIRGAFTVVEVSIFMAAAGVMFLSAVTIFTRYQRETQFNQSVKQLESELSDFTNDVVTGVFPELNGFRCDASPGGSISFAVDAAARAGSNNDCTFLGKVIQFGDSPISGATDMSDIDPDPDYHVHTVVGINDPHSGLSSFNPTVDNDFQTLRSSGAVSFDTTESGEMQWGTGITGVYIDTLPSRTYVRGLAIMYDTFGELNGLVGGNPAFISGRSSVSLYAVVDGPNQYDINSSRLDEDSFEDSITYNNVNGTPPSTRLIKLPDASGEGLIICIKNRQNLASIEVSGRSSAPIVNFNPGGVCA